MQSRSAPALTGCLRVGLVGLGKIARDQHLPAIAATIDMDLVAIASRNAVADGVNNYPDLAAMLAGEAQLDAVILCQPPEARFDAAQMALRAGKHVFLEKPPGATVSEVEALIMLATDNGVTLFASWHSRFGAAVPSARDWVAGRAIDNVTILWKEDIRQWHPGQEWILQAGGFGVFDPGINALSILTEILGESVWVIKADLQVPINCQAPIAANLRMVSGSGVPIFAELSFLQSEPQQWEIIIESAADTMRLADGGACLAINDVVQKIDAQAEYPAMYAHFAELVRAGKCDADLGPLKLVADAFLRGSIRTVDHFDF
jgi:D-galactose 1-dehydrogenase